MSSTAFTLQHPSDFERNVVRGVVAGAISAVAQQVLYRGLGVLWSGAPRPFPQGSEAELLPLWYLVIAGAVAAAARGDRRDRGLLIGLGFTLPAIPWFLGLSLGWTVALSAAVGGVLLVRSRRSAIGEEGQLGSARAGTLNLALGACLSAALAAGGLEVAITLATRLQALSAPSLAVAVVAGAVLALFFSLGQIAAHLGLEPDPVEARCDELLPRLSGELRALAGRAVELYRACGRAMSSLPREPLREELARSLGTLTQAAVEVAAEWASVEAHLQGQARPDLGAQIADLQKSASAAQDPIARRQLEDAAASLSEEQERLEALALRRERVVARLKSDLALLERTRLSLVGVQLGNAELRAADLGALSRRLQTLAAAQADQAQLTDTVATERQAETLNVVRGW